MQSHVQSSIVYCIVLCRWSVGQSAVTLFWNAGLTEAQLLDVEDRASIPKSKYPIPPLKQVIDNVKQADRSMVMTIAGVLLNLKEVEWSAGPAIEGELLNPAGMVTIVCNIKEQVEHLKKLYESSSRDDKILIMVDVSNSGNNRMWINRL